MNVSWFQPGPHAVIADFSALASFTSEDSLLKGVAKQPLIYANYFDQPGKKWSFHAAGVFGCTGTPTLQWGGRLKTTQGVSVLDGSSVGQSPAITLGSGVTNERWDYWLTLTCRTPGQGSGGLTLNCSGLVLLSYSSADAVSRTLLPSPAHPATWTTSRGRSRRRSRSWTIWLIWGSTPSN